MINPSSLKIFEIEVKKVSLGGQTKRLCTFRDKSNSVKSLLEVQELKLAKIVSVKLEEEQQTQLNSIVTSTELLAEWLN